MKIHLAYFVGRPTGAVDWPWSISPWPHLECSLLVDEPLATRDPGLVTCGLCLRYWRIRGCRDRDRHDELWPGPEVLRLRRVLIEQPNPYHPEDEELWSHWEHEIVLSEDQLADALSARQQRIEAVLA